VLPALRTRPALLVSLGLGAAFAPALLPLACGPTAIGADACRKIEGARCEAAAACGFDEAEIEDCKLLYQDQCLHGIENTEHRPTDTDTEACVAAVKAAGDCAASGVETMSGCPAAPVIAGIPDRAPCDIVLSRAHELQACAFAEGAPDAGTVMDAAGDADATTD
jgi:hypothetical protein